MEEERILDKIQKLIDKAYGNTTEAEKMSLLAKADEMMLKYSIDQLLLLDPLRPNTAPNVKHQMPELRQYQVGFTDADYLVKWAMQEMFRATAKHLFVRIGNLNYSQATCVGYPSDLDFLEMFYLRLKIHMVSSLDPKVDPALTWQRNMADLKNVGYKWQDIHYKLDAHPNYPFKDMRWERRFGVKFTNEMKKLADSGQIEIRNTAGNLANWRSDFIAAYVHRLNQRFREVREGTLRSDSNLPALLNDKKSAVDEAFYDAFPDMRPHPATCECDTCHGYCSDPTCTRPKCKNWQKDSKRPVRYRAEPSRAYNGLAYSSGAKAADRADLSAGGSLK